MFDRLIYLLTILVPQRVNHVKNEVWKCKLNLCKQTWSFVKYTVQMSCNPTWYLKELKNLYPYMELVLGRWYQLEVVLSRQTALDSRFIPL